MTKTKSSSILELADKLGLTKENVEFGLKKEKTKVEAAIRKAAKIMGVD